MQSQGVPATLISNIKARVHHDLAPALTLKPPLGHCAHVPRIQSVLHVCNAHALRAHTTFLSDDETF